MISLQRRGSAGKTVIVIFRAARQLHNFLATVAFYHRTQQTCRKLDDKIVDLHAYGRLILNTANVARTRFDAGRFARSSVMKATVANCCTTSSTVKGQKTYGN